MTVPVFDQAYSRSEERLVEKIRRHPTSREAMISLARYFESVGNDDEAKRVYRGQLPSRVIGQFKLAELDACHSKDAEGTLSLKKFSAEKMVLSPPRNQDLRRNTVFTRTHTQCQSEYVDLVDDCSFYFDGVNSLVVNRAGAEISNHSSVNACLLHHLVVRKRRPARRLSGLTLILAGRNDKNFYHWFHDHLPKIGMVEASGVSIGDIQNVIVKNTLTPFQRESLFMLGIGKDQLVYVDEANIAVQCEKLLLPKLCNNMGMSQSRRHLLWLRRSKLTQNPSYNLEKTVGLRKIAIMREQRGFSNSGEISTHLERLGYRATRCEQLPLYEQIRLFSTATHIVAPHGAALALLVFCSPGTIVHEFYGPHVHPCFWSVSSANRLKYHNYNCSLVSNGEITTSNKGASQRKASKLTVDMELLKSIAL